MIADECMCSTPELGTDCGARSMWSGIASDNLLFERRGIRVNANVCIAKWNLAPICGIASLLLR